MGRLSDTDLAPDRPRRRLTLRSIAEEPYPRLMPLSRYSMTSLAW